jgi:hypothetical protein
MTKFMDTKEDTIAHLMAALEENEYTVTFVLLVSVFFL